MQFKESGFFKIFCRASNLCKYYNDINDRGWLAIYREIEQAIFSRF